MSTFTANWNGNGLKMIIKSSIVYLFDDSVLILHVSVFDNMLDHVVTVLILDKLLQIRV